LRSLWLKNLRGLRGFVFIVVQISLSVSSASSVVNPFDETAPR
jgi:hypothetical protein